MAPVTDVPSVTRCPNQPPFLHTRAWDTREEAGAGSHEGAGVYYYIIIIVLLYCYIIMYYIYSKPAGLLLISSSREGAEAPRLRGLRHCVTLLLPSAGCRARGGAGDVEEGGGHLLGARDCPTPQKTAPTLPQEYNLVKMRTVPLPRAGQPLSSVLALGGGESQRGAFHTHFTRNPPSLGTTRTGQHLGWRKGGFPLPFFPP